MVRVISVYNFLKQEISSIDESVDVAEVPPDILLLAQPNNTILVKDLSQIKDPGYTIPTVDQVVKIVYSVNGNYIAALETKTTRSGTKVSHARVYINWESMKDCKDLFPMRARIAERVTPLSQSQNGLEMVEIPNQYMPEYISCCPVSGNLLVSSRNVLSIYLFITQTHDISKIHFIDFKQLNFDLHISFTPKKHQIIEDMIAVQNDEFLHIFRIKSAVPLCSLSDKEFSIDEFEKPKPSVQKTNSSPYKTINYKKLLNEVDKLNFPLPIDNEEELQKKISECFNLEETEILKIDMKGLPLKHEFPSIALEKTLFQFRGSDVFRQNPFTATKDLFVNFVTNSTSPTSNNAKNEFKAINLCQYHLIPLTLGNIPNREVIEKFTFLILKPYYSHERKLKKYKNDLLESEYYPNLKSIACFFGTQQEGYLQCFEYNNKDDDDTVTCGNYFTYAFTAPIIDVKLEDCFLHAITEIGLETYTLRAAKHLYKKNENVDCPSLTDPVCLIGLHPFVNLFQSCLTNNYLTLFANNEESSSTLYQLKLPDIMTVWNDFLTSAEENKWESPLTYSELLGEGHLILKTKLNTFEWSWEKDANKNSLCYAKPTTPNSNDNVKSLYKESCALFGDYHILNKNYQSCYCYYSMSEYKILDIIKRIKNLKNNVPGKYRDDYEEGDITKGLIYFLKKKLSHYDLKYYEFSGSNREEFYNSEIGNLVTSLMDLLETVEKESISDLVLDSVVLREFSTDRILKILKSLLSKNSVPFDKDALSLALMCIQRDQCEQAKTVLLTMSAKQLENLLIQYYDLLFSNHGSTGLNMFTELSMILIEIHPKVLASVLSQLVTEKRLLSLSKVLKIFLDIVPTGCRKNSSFVLQNVLEKYFKYHAENFEKFNYKTTEALKILIRIYLMQLQGWEEEGDREEDDEKCSEVLFQKHRPNYLNEVPPFSPELKDVFTKTSSSTEEKREEKNKKGKMILYKLQCIICYENLPDECLAEVRNFLINNQKKKEKNVYGELSLKILSAVSVEEAVDLLIDYAPRPLFKFSKERIKDKEKWKYLIVRLLEKIDDCKNDERMKFFIQQILSGMWRAGARAGK
ncbi:hypothetical protein Phum_PHUM601870 [Pediculus humanus corporis]|uniref:BLOC-2 complex member HPS3 N-terminal domain-containing protein n=1 Tax=Pediculus humanus subsp. corporis TaxID=121224 RepID=E0W381_PEDHC|nr:uncharacterized protein Phum_PHUM601870 [Pediculus humanus corporis]EEB20087.1 hypothetical protein Phum_PHUM601870 [Pediculus humanus corporis]